MSVNQGCVVSDAPPLTQLYHEPSLSLYHIVGRVRDEKVSLLEGESSLTPPERLTLEASAGLDVCILP